MKKRLIIIVVITTAAVVILAAGLTAVLWVFGPDAFDFAGGKRVELAKYSDADPTGVPSELKNASLIQRGEYLARAADCQGCHTAPSGLPYAGGLAISTPFGTLYSTNITPDKATGIGDYSDAEFLGAVHEGIRRDGVRLYPAMPYPSYTYMTDADAIAIKAFLLSLQPVHAPAREDRLSFPFNQRYLMRVWSLLFNANKRYEPNVDRSPLWNRGAYLAEAMAHCGDCHTPRGIFEALNNRQKFAGAVVDNWRAYNITPQHGSGLGDWSDADLARYLSTGHADGHGTATGPMGEAVALSMSYLTAGDIAAIIEYLRTIPPIVSTDLPPPRSVVSTSVTSDSTAAIFRGETVFSRACAACHGSNGVSPLTPLATLTGSRAVNDPTGDNIVQVVLFGARDFTTMMPAFEHVLSDDDVADVVNYVTSRFGAAPSAVTAARVTAIRNHAIGPEGPVDQAAARPIAANLAPHLPLAQPIPFSHQTHVGLGLECRNCHINREISSDMSLPPAASCMACHATVDKDHPAIKKVAEFAASGQPVPWARVYPLLSGVQFSHEPHLHAGVRCVTCHGPVADMPALSELTAVTSMATCISCHQTQKVGAECETCHAWPAQSAHLGSWPFPASLPFPESPTQNRPNN
jgi:mono/diheme cytochrome c family protein